jgi:hypothetical protein
MTIHEKLHGLLKFSNRKAVCKAAGVSYSSLSSSLMRKSAISSSTATALANVLGVDVGWLVDDSREWPAVRRGTMFEHAA